MTHTPAPPFTYTSGPRNAKIALVGEAWGEQEALTGMPFVGVSGQELTRLLKEAGIARKECFLTNVFPFRPDDKNNLETICVNKAAAGVSYPYRHIKMGKYIDPQYLGEIDRLRAELVAVKPNLIVALGNTACWALFNDARVSAYRGTIVETPLGKVLPTYHPAALFRNWSWRVITVADLMKAKREAEHSDFRRPERRIITNPTTLDICYWIAGNNRARYIAVDIETKNRQIEMIGFAASRDEALVIPFVDFTKPDNSYWPTEMHEKAAWDYVELILQLPAEKIFQNGLFDLQYIYRMGLKIRNPNQDTMLKHHSMYPELRKGLAFLGSIYTNEPAWKLDRERGEELKRDE